MLRVQSRVTNTPVEQLRMEFINAFTSAPTVSEGRTKSFVEAATKDSAITSKQPVTPVEITPATQTLDLDTEVRNVIKDMKNKDPDINEEYFFNAYTRADPKKKKEFIDALKSNTLKQSDLNVQ
jgi:hypothetical protein